MRHAGSARFRLSSPAARRYENAGRKLLGELLERGRAEGVQTLSLRRQLQDGALVVAHMHGEQLIVEITAPEDLRRSGTIKLESQLAQGFVTKPSTPDDATFEEIVLDPRWTAITSERYLTNPLKQKLFEDGLHNHTGNVDWRDHDDKFSIWWGGMTDRYFGLYVSGNFKGRKAWINGDAIVDLTSHPDLTSADIVIGCCLQGSTLVVCVARERSSSLIPGRIKVYTAPLARKDDPGLAWANAFPLKQCPRFEPVDVGDWTEVLSQTFDPDDWSGVCDGHPMCFNQSGTEGRMLVRYRIDRLTTDPNVEIRELVLDVSDLSSVSLNSSTYTESPYSDREAEVTDIVVQLSAIHVIENVLSSDPIPVPYESEYWDGASTGTGAGGYINEASYSEIATSRNTWLPAAVDYQNDVPVYAYFRGWDSTKTGTYEATPTAVFTSSHTVGYTGVGTSTIDHSTSQTQYVSGMRLPWDMVEDGHGGLAEAPFEFEVTSTEESSSHTDGSATIDYDYYGDPDYPASIPDLSLATTGTWELSSFDRVLVPLFVDLRNKVAAYAIRENESAIDESYAWNRLGSDSAPERGIDTTRDNHYTTRLRTILHVNGVDVADSGMVDITTFDQVDTISNSASIGSNSPNWVKVGWLPVHDWNIIISVANGTIISSSADDTTMQALIDAIPIPPNVAYPTGTYDLTPVYATSDHPDITDSFVDTTSHFGTMQDPSFGSGRYFGPFRELYGTGMLMSWAEVFPDAFGTTHRTVCSVCANLAGDFVASLAWPGSGGTDGWLNTLNAPPDTIGEVTDNASAVFIPIWLTTEFGYVFSQRAEP